MEKTDSTSCVKCTDSNARSRRQSTGRSFGKDVDSPFKQSQKTIKPTPRRRSSSRSEDLNLAFVQDFNSLDMNNGIAQKNGNNSDDGQLLLKKKKSTFNLEFNKYQQNLTASKSEEKVVQYRRNSCKYTKPSCNNNNSSALNTAFISENMETTNSSIQTTTDKFLEGIEVNLKTSFILDGLVSNRRQKQRRLSGRFLRTLDTAFMEDSNLDDNENIISINESLLTTIPEQEFVVENTDSNVRTILTPVKSKLRKKPTKNLTEIEIIKYYTDKTVPAKQSCLETIYEASLPKEMSCRKFKRYINFNERMNNAKKKKRHTKVLKYKLWENVSPVSMEYFVSQMLDIEEDV